MSLIREYLNELGKESRKLRFTLIAQLLPFLLLTIGWLLFPFLEKWNLGFQTFYSTCGLAFLIACSGICFWLIERFTKGRKPSWPRLIFLTLLLLGSVAALVYGNSYWAFTRGYFLD